MTKEEAISELVVIKSVYSHMRGEYKPCVEALQMAIDLLRQADTPLTERPSCESCKWDSEEWYDSHCDSCVAHTDKPSNYEPKAEIPKNALRSDCTGCRFVGTYDTEFPCANCTRKNKDYYTAE